MTDQTNPAPEQTSGATTNLDRLRDLIRSASLSCDTTWPVRQVMLSFDSIAGAEKCHRLLLDLAHATPERTSGPEPDRLRIGVDAADKIMTDYFGKRWVEDSHLNDVWAAIRSAVADALPRVAPVPLTVPNPLLEPLKESLALNINMYSDSEHEFQAYYSEYGAVKKMCEAAIAAEEARAVAPVDVEQAAQPLLKALEEIRMNMQGVLDGAHPHFTKRDLAGAAVHVCERALDAIRARGEAPAPKSEQETRDA